MRAKFWSAWWTVYTGEVAQPDRYVRVTMYGNEYVYRLVRKDEEGVLHYVVELD